MIRNIKALGLLTVAALAISAMAASAAQAEVTITAGHTPETHTATSYHAVQYGTTTENYLEANGAKVTCENAKVSLQGMASGDDKDLTINTPKYEGCGLINTEDGNNLNVNVNMNGCEYTFNQPTFLETDTYTGTVDLKCAGGGPLVSVFTSSKKTTLLCETEILPNQTGLKHVVYHNKNNAPEKDDITVTVTIESIKYKNVKGAGCPDLNVTHENGVYKANYTLTSTVSTTDTTPAEDDIWISGK